MARKKSLCVALALFLIIGEIYFLRGEAASSAGIENDSSPGTEISVLTEEDISSTGAPKAAKPGKSDVEEWKPANEEITEETKEDIPGTEEPETPKEEASEIEPTETATEETSETETTEETTEETSDPEISEPAETEGDESEAVKSETSETEASETIETETVETETAEASPDDTPSERGFSVPDGLASLQIPEKLEVVLDPWEIDGKGQIHSELYIVKNSGDISGILTLSFQCRVNEENGVAVRETREGIHESGKKLLYMKIVFGDGSEAVFTGDKAEYQVELAPGEEISLCFEGEVNENADEPWRDGDIEITGIYSWEDGTAHLEENGEEGSETERETEQEESLPATVDETVSDGGDASAEEPVQESKEEQDGSEEPEETGGEESMSSDDGQKGV